MMIIVIILLVLILLSVASKEFLTIIVGILVFPFVFPWAVIIGLMNGLYSKKNLSNKKENPEPIKQDNYFKSHKFDLAEKSKSPVENQQPYIKKDLNKILEAIRNQKD